MNTGVAPTGQGTDGDKNPNTQPASGKNNEPKKRTHKKYIPSINRTALNDLVGTTTSSFVDLAEAVILIDGDEYDHNKLPMSKARKIDFERLISYYAQLEVYGKRKYHIKSVFDRVQKKIDNDVELEIKKKSAYTKAKPLTEAQKEARRMLSKAKREKEKREEAIKDAKTMQDTQRKIAELEEPPEAETPPATPPEAPQTETPPEPPKVEAPPKTPKNSKPPAQDPQ